MEGMEQKERFLTSPQCLSRTNELLKGDRIEKMKYKKKKTVSYIHANYFNYLILF